MKGTNATITVTDYEIGVDILNFPILSRHVIIRPDNEQFDIETAQTIVRIGLPKIREKRIKNQVEKEIGFKSFVIDCLLFQSREKENIILGIWLYLMNIIIWTLTYLLINYIKTKR